MLEEGGPGLRLPFVLQTDAARINDQDLPFGTGTTPPQMRGRGPLLIAAKDFARLIAFLRKADPERLGGLDSLQSGLPSFLRINIDGLLGGLHGDGTISSDDGLSHFAARTDPPDPGDWRTPLNRLSTLSSVLQRLGIDNIKLDEEPGDAYRLEIDGKLTARVGIFGPTLVITDDADTNLRATRGGPRRPAAAGGEGRPHAAPPGERGAPPARQPPRRRRRPPGGGRSRRRRHPGPLRRAHRMGPRGDGRRARRARPRPALSAARPRPSGPRPAGPAAGRSGAALLDAPAADPDLEVQVRAGRVAGVADAADRLAGRDGRARRDARSSRPGSGRRTCRAPSAVWSTMY